MLISLKSKAEALHSSFFSKLQTNKLLNSLFAACYSLFAIRFLIVDLLISLKGKAKALHSTNFFSKPQTVLLGWEKGLQTHKLTNSKLYFPRRAQDSNPQVLADGGFQVHCHTVRRALQVLPSDRKYVSVNLIYNYAFLSCQ